MRGQFVRVAVMRVKRQHVRSALCTKGRQDAQCRRITPYMMDAGLFLLDLPQHPPNPDPTATPHKACVAALGL